MWSLLMTAGSCGIRWAGVLNADGDWGGYAVVASVFVAGGPESKTSAGGHGWCSTSKGVQAQIYGGVAEFLCVQARPCLFLFSPM